MDPGAQNELLFKDIVNSLGSGCAYLTYESLQNLETNDVKELFLKLSCDFIIRAKFRNLLMDHTKHFLFADHDQDRHQKCGGFVGCGMTKKLLLCSRCLSVYYCSPEHQKNDHETHKTICKKIKESFELSLGTGKGTIAEAMLIKSSECNGSIKLLKQAFDLFANIEYKYGTTWADSTILLIACENKLIKSSYIQSLIDNGANVNCRNKYGKSPLIEAWCIGDTFRRNSATVVTSRSNC